MVLVKIVVKSVISINDVMMNVNSSENEGKDYIASCHSVVTALQNLELKISLSHTFSSYFLLSLNSLLFWKFPEILLFFCYFHSVTGAILEFITEEETIWGKSKV